MLAALAYNLGCEVQRFNPIPDLFEVLAAAAERVLASPAHTIIFCAGSSSGIKKLYT
ncbi:hypothetical protein DSUL_100101 [Desulfovibrionales bacterium]